MNTKRAIELQNINRRGREHACALDFLVYGDDEERGAHATRCICSPHCSRDYVLEDEPTDQELYAGTGIGALYGFADGDYRQLWQLAGWNVV